MKVYTCIICCLAFFYCAAFKGGDTANVQQKLAAYYQKFPGEKLYIQTDETFYVTGQNIWYKIYGLTYDEPTRLSKVVYLQLADDKGKVLLLQKLPMPEGSAAGNMVLPAGIKSGVYQLCGFTNWMLNFNGNTVFTKSIYIQNVQEDAAPTAAASNKFCITFYPEGGYLVDTNLCNIAFKAVSEDALPANVYGEVKDKTGKTIAAIRTLHNGMGSFNIRPMPGQTYTAIVHFADSSIQKIILPAARPSGITIRVIEQIKTDVDISITYRGNNLKQFETLTLAAWQANGKNGFFPLQLHAGPNIFTVPTGDFNPGVLHLVFSDNANNVIAERNIFIHPREALQAAISKSANTDTSASYKVSISTAAGQAVTAGNFSIAITDMATDGNDEPLHNIYSNLLLSNGANNFIYNPAWYFIHKGDSVRTALNLVMQTNTWPVLTLDTLTHLSTETPHYMAEQDLYVAGQLVNYSTLAAKAKPSVKLQMQKPDSTQYAGYVTLDKSGRFTLLNYNFTGSNKLYFATFSQGKLDSNAVIQLHTSPADSMLYSPGKFIPLYNNNLLQSSAWHSYIMDERERQNKKATVTNAPVKKQSIPQPNPLPSTSELVNAYTSAYFNTPSTTTIDVINNDYSRVPGFFQLIKPRLQGLVISGSERAPAFQLADTLQPTDTSKASTERPYFFINEVLVAYEDVRQIPIESIALVRHIPAPFNMAPAKGGKLGAIVVYLKKGGEVSFKKAFKTSKMPSFILDGYSNISTGFTGDSSNRTIYWNANIQPGAGGNYSITLPNITTGHRYRAVIEGMDSTGRLLYCSAVINQ